MWCRPASVARMSHSARRIFWGRGGVDDIVPELASFFEYFAGVFVTGGLEGGYEFDGSEFTLAYYFATEGVVGEEGCAVAV